MQSKEEFYKKAQKIKEKFTQYKEDHNVMASPLAYMERYDRREPADMINERAKLFTELKHTVKHGHIEGLSFDEIAQGLKDKNIPMSYVRKSIRLIEKEEKLQSSHNKDGEDRELERDIAIAKLKKDYEKKQDIKEQHDEELSPSERAMMQENLRRNEARCMIEKAMREGFDQRELFAMANEFGVESAEAKQMVEDIVDQEEERWFITGEQKEMEEYIEEELEMTHTL